MPGAGWGWAALSSCAASRCGLLLVRDVGKAVDAECFVGRRYGSLHPGASCWAWPTAASLSLCSASRCGLLSVRDVVGQLCPVAGWAAGGNVEEDCNETGSDAGVLSGGGQLGLLQCQTMQARLDDFLQNEHSGLHEQLWPLRRKTCLA